MINETMASLVRDVISLSYVVTLDAIIICHISRYGSPSIYDSLSVAKLLRKTVFYMLNGLRRPPGSLCNLLYSSSLKL